MTREKAAELLPIMKAFAEGKNLQSLVGSVDYPNVWANDNYPVFHGNSNYRIKPEPLVIWANVYADSGKDEDRIGVACVNRENVPESLSRCGKLTKFIEVPE